MTAVLKTARKVLERPDYARRMVRLEIDKLARKLLPLPSDGRGGGIRQCSVRITDVCNLRCHTCGQWGDGGFLRGRSVRDLRNQEIPKERYLELLRDLSLHGHTPSVYLWGGEPMLYGGTLEILEEAARLGMPPSIATNGTGIEKHALRLVDAPLFLLQVSVDGPDAHTHNACRPGVGSASDNFSTVLRAIETIGAIRKERGRRLPLVASLTTVNRLNHDRLIAIHDLLAPRVDLCVFYLAWWIDEAAAEQHSQDFSRRFGFRPEKHLGWIGDWKPDNYRVLSHQLETLSRRGGEMRGPAVVILPHLTSTEELERYYTDHAARFGFERCVSIFSAVELNSNGDLSPCRDYHDFVVGNVREHSIVELWNSEPFRRFRKSLSTDGLMPVCTRCCGLMGY